MTKLWQWGVVHIHVDGLGVGIVGGVGPVLPRRGLRQGRLVLRRMADRLDRRR